MGRGLFAGLPALAACVAAALTGAAGTPAKQPSAPASVRVQRPLAPGTGLRPATHVRWCGTDAAGADRKPEGSSGRQVHVVYAIPAGGADRFASLASLIASDVAGIDAWWRGQDPARSPRFDLFPFPGCEPGFGQLDISRVQLAHDGAYFAPLDSRFLRLATDLAAAGFDDPAKKILLFYDGPVEAQNVCGQSLVLPDQGGLRAVAAVFLGTVCRPEDLGLEAVTASVAAHELVHNLGALVSPGPLHPCPGDPGHPCDLENDLMYPVSRGQGLSQLVLDAGRDDYYGHTGSWFDVQDSGWLSRLDLLRQPLTVSLQGPGSVVSDLPGIACPVACSILWDGGSAVTLRASPQPSARFLGWGGACRGTASCAVTVSAATSVVARFAFQATLSVSVVRRRGAAGKVTSRPAGISCPAACRFTFTRDSVVALRVTPAARSRFAGWSGACKGLVPCSVRLSAARSVRATFVRP